MTTVWIIIATCTLVNVGAAALTHCGLKQMRVIAGEIRDDLRALRGVLSDKADKE